jgi:hypothetical protein
LPLRFSYDLVHIVISSTHDSGSTNINYPHKKAGNNPEKLYGNWVLSNYNSIMSPTSLCLYKSLQLRSVTCSHSCTLKMEAIRSSETSVLIRATRCHLPDDDNHHSHRRGNLKSYNYNSCYTIVIFSHVEQNTVGLWCVVPSCSS